MATKTCGECKFYCDDAAFCSHYGVGWKQKTDMVCKDFEPTPKPTNGDKVRQMSNEELAELIDNSCKACAKDVAECDTECVNGILDWLNASAEGEVER